MERLETRLALYLAGTAAVEDWVVHAGAQATSDGRGSANRKKTASRFLGFQTLN